MTTANKLAYEVAVEKVGAVLKKAKATKMVESAIATGTSWFEGKERLCKVLKTKKGVTLEINQDLNKELLKKLEKGQGILEVISPARAKEKHLGTMKYLYKTMNVEEVTEIVTDALSSLRKKQGVVEVPVKEEAKPEAKSIKKDAKKEEAKPEEPKQEEPVYGPHPAPAQ